MSSDTAQTRRMTICILDCLMIVHEHLFFECALTFYTAAMISDQIVAMHASYK